MGTTTHGFPYPEPTDNVDVAADVEALAAAIDLVYARLAGPIAQVSSTANSSAIGTTETVVSTAPSTTYKAGRAYKVQVNGAYIQSTTTSYSAWKIRKASASGTILIDFPRVSVVGHLNGTDLPLKQRLFVVGGSDVTTALVLTAVSSASSTVIHQGFADCPRGFDVIDVGPASLYTGRPTLS